MPADAISSILGGLTDGVVAACLGFLFGYILFRIQRQRKTIEYDISVIPILQIRPTDPSWTMSVDKSNLTNDPNDKGTLVPLVNAFVFKIDVLNSGNEAILNPSIEISLDKNAKIVTHETLPLNRLGYDVLVERDPVKQNDLIVKFPYINSNEVVSIQVISTDNDDVDCSVNVLVPGIQQHARHTPLPIVPFLLICFGLFTIISFTILPPTWFGGHTETVSVKFADGTTETRTITRLPPNLLDSLNMLGAVFMVMGIVLMGTIWYRHEKRWGRISQEGLFVFLIGLTRWDRHRLVP